MATAGDKLLAKCLTMDEAEALTASKPDILDRLVELRAQGVPFTINACVPTVSGDGSGDFAMLVTAGYVNTDVDTLSEITQNKDESTGTRTVAFLVRTMRDAACTVQCGLNVAGSTGDTETVSSLIDFLGELNEYANKPEVTH